MWLKHTFSHIIFKMPFVCGQALQHCFLAARESLIARIADLFLTFSMYLTLYFNLVGVGLCIFHAINDVFLRFSGDLEKKPL
jgi:hypothetical protein